jgi:hypothetical protein
MAQIRSASHDVDACAVVFGMPHTKQTMIAASFVYFIATNATAKEHRPASDCTSKNLR